MVLKKKGDFEFTDEETLFTVEKVKFKTVVLNSMTDPNDPAKKILQTKKYPAKVVQKITLGELKELLK